MKTLIPLGLALSVLSLQADAQQQEYDSKGRRDPFVTFGTLGAAEKPSCPGPGLGSRLVQEVTLSGLVRTPEGRKAMLVTPDGQTHFAAERSQLCDGRVLRIDADGVVFLKRLNDPLAPAREVEVRRSLHPER